MLNFMSLNQQTLDVNFLFAESLEHITGCTAVWATLESLKFFEKKNDILDEKIEIEEF